MEDFEMFRTIGSPVVKRAVDVVLSKEDYSDRFYDNFFQIADENEGFESKRKYI